MVHTRAKRSDNRSITPELDMILLHMAAVDLDQPGFPGICPKV